MLNLEFYDYIGIIGATIILLFFILNQMDKIKNDSPYYDFGNFLGSAFLVFFAIKTNS
jgi:cytochrome bd-type quinol oxidase subunit 1